MTRDMRSVVRDSDPLECLDTSCSQPEIDSSAPCSRASRRALPPVVPLPGAGLACSVAGAEDWGVGVTRIHRVVGCVALVVALAGCWPQPGQGPDRAAYNPHETTLTPASVGGMRRLWSVEPGRIVGSPVMSPAGIHVAAFDDTGGLDLLTYGANGAARWSRRVTPDAVPYVHASSG